MDTTTATQAQHDERAIARIVEQARGWGQTPADLLAIAGEYDADDEGGIGDWHRAAAEIIG